VSRYDDQFGQAFFECDHSQQVFAVALGIPIGPSAHDPRAFLAQRDSFQLPNEVAYERVVRSGGQRHKDDHAAGSVTCRRYNNDRTVTVDVVACAKAEVWAAFKSILFIANAGEGFAELALSTWADELVPLRSDPHGDVGKVGQAADMVPMTMGQKNGAQRFLVVAGSFHLIDGGLLDTIRSDNTQAPRQRPKLLVDVAAEAGVDEQVALGVIHQGSGH
jgi:hypothetical protein